MFCVTQLKEAHFIEQTDHPSPGTDVLDKGTHLAVTHMKAVARSCRVGSAEPPGSRPDATWREDCSYPLEVGLQCFHVKEWREPTSKAIKGALPHPSHTHTYTWASTSPSYSCISVPLGVLHLVEYLEKRRVRGEERRRCRVCRSLPSFCTSTDPIQLELHPGYHSVFLSLLFV